MRVLLIAKSLPVLSVVLTCWLAFAAPCQAATETKPVGEALVGEAPADAILLEAEGFALAGKGWTVNRHQEGVYSQQPSKLKFLAGPGHEPGEATHRFHVPQAGRYRIWVRYLDAWGEVNRSLFKVSLQQNGKTGEHVFDKTWQRASEAGLKKWSSGYIVWIWDFFEVDLQAGDCTITLTKDNSGPPTIWRYVDCFLLTRDLAWDVDFSSDQKLIQNPVYARFKLLEPTGAKYHLKLGGTIHHSPWWLAAATWPRDAAANPAARFASGEWTPWLNLRELETQEAKLHTRLRRSGGVAEFPNIAVDFLTDAPAPRRKIQIELALDPDAGKVLKRLEEEYSGDATSFLVSPDLESDAAELETASQMTERHLRWAREASGGKSASPKKLMVISALMPGQREELLYKEAEAMRLLGINTISYHLPELLEKFDFKIFAYNSIGSRLDAATTREDARQNVQESKRWIEQRFGKNAARVVGVGVSDEIRAEPFAEAMKHSREKALTHFHQWLRQKKIAPAFLGAQNLEEVVPLDTPPGDAQAAQMTDIHQKRLFYLSCRFRQEALNERLRWLTEETRAAFGPEFWTHTMPADHPFFGGAGVGFGKTGTWGDFLSGDWFGMARSGAVDSLGVEDWLGLQYMYGGNYTWEGFQLLGYMANIFRSGARSSGRSEMPMIGWITPSDETNLRLKSASCLARGVKNFFVWTYGPTSVSTENYWSDLKSEYDGVAALSRHLAKGEDILIDGKQRPTRLALLHSISSDIWQPYGYATMLERRLTYLSLIHDQYDVDMLTEEDVIAGRLANYDVLYTCDPNIKMAAATKIAQWVQSGGILHASAAAGSRDEYNEPSARLNPVFGLQEEIKVTAIDGNYKTRSALNSIVEPDRVKMPDAQGAREFGALGMKVQIAPLASAKVLGAFNDGAPAVIENGYGKGRARYFATCPAISYAKDAKFVYDALKEQWPVAQRHIINHSARAAKIARPVELAVPVVETGLYDSPRGLAVVLGNYTYKPIKSLEVRVHGAAGVKKVESCEGGVLPFTREKNGAIKFRVPLQINDLILLRR